MSDINPYKQLAIEALSKLEVKQAENLIDSIEAWSAQQSRFSWVPDSDYGRDGTCWDLLVDGKECSTWVCQRANDTYSARVLGEVFHDFRSIKEASEFVMQIVLKRLTGEPQFEPVCECFTEEDAELICAALNREE